MMRRAGPRSIDDHAGGDGQINTLMDNDTTTAARLRRERLETAIIERFISRGQTLPEAKAYLATCILDLEEVLRRIANAR